MEARRRTVEPLAEAAPRVPEMLWYARTAAPAAKVWGWRCFTDLRRGIVDKIYHVVEMMHQGNNEGVTGSGTVIGREGLAVGGGERDHVPIHDGGRGVRAQESGGRAAATIHGREGRDLLAATVAVEDAGRRAGGDVGQARPGHDSDSRATPQGIDRLPMSGRPHVERPQGGAAEAPTIYVGSASGGAPAELRRREGGCPATRANPRPDQRSGCAVLSHGDAEAAAVDDAVWAPRRRIYGKRKFEQGRDDAQRERPIQRDHHGAQWPKEATVAGDACGADEFNEPAARRTRMRSKTGDAHRVCQRQGDEPLQENERAGDLRDSRRQMKSQKYPSSIAVTSSSSQATTRTAPYSSRSRASRTQAGSALGTGSGDSADGIVSSMP